MKKIFIAFTALLFLLPATAKEKDFYGKNNKIYYYTGQYEVITTDSGVVTRPKQDSVKYLPVDNDSISVDWYDETHWYITPKNSKKNMMYKGKFDTALAASFEAKWLVNIQTGEKKKANTTYDRAKGTYQSIISAGWILDPGYSAVPIGNGVGFFTPDSLPSPHWVNATHSYPFNDTNASGVVADAGTGPAANCQLLNGIKLAPGFNSAYVTTAKSCSLDGVNDTALISSGMTSMDSAGAYTLSYRMKILSNANGTIMGSKFTGANSYLYDQYTAADSLVARWIRVNAGTAISAKFKISHPEQWNRITWKFDSTQSTNATRLIAMLNGVQQTLTFSTTWPTKSNNFSGRFYIGAITGLGVPIRGLIDEVRITGGSVRPSNELRTNLSALIETVRRDSLKSSTAGTANAKFWTGGQSIDSLFVSTSAKSLHYGIGTNDTTLNIYTLFSKDTVYEDSTIIRTLLPSGDSLVRYYDTARVESKGDVADTLIDSTSNDVGTATASTRYLCYLRCVYQRIYDSDTLYKPIISSVSPASGSVGTIITISGSKFYTQGSGTVTIGGHAPTSYTSWSDTEIKVVAGPHAEEKLSIIVNNQYGLADTLANAFTYTSENKGIYNKLPYKKRANNKRPYAKPVYEQGDDF